MNVREELLEIVRDYVDVPDGEIDTSLALKFIGLNSYAALSMVNVIEDHFNVSIPDEDLKSFKTLDDIIAYLTA